ncbi:carbohydrate kinase [Sulfitobacter sp. G21635-S1]|uniref:carbohydrate kinase family protein n=1 Tax=Sulfitobacter sp. G21635-S1 TaxID=3014043 RepID=UPI0022AF96B3|nr:carbohydrate kinase [Sulfitobacter sp. G21635-S1]MCZ4257299.1 carbohydrate kinase [Sulfitobacter sp. G21635-S1]
MILCAGEALIDMLPIPGPSGDSGFAPHVGGAIFNTAIALGRLGVPAGMLTGISTDSFGKLLSAALTANGVDTAHVVHADRPTTLAFVELNGGQASYMFYDENSAGRMLSPQELPQVGDDVTALYFGGISLACEPCADTYADLLAQAGAGRAVMIDPNIRPGFVRDANRFRTRLGAMLRQADIVKVSDEDLTWLHPDPMPVPDKVRALLGHGPALVIVTRGGEGATAYLADGTEVTVPALRAEVVDTVGAGDTFNAGVLASLTEQGLLSKDALRGLTTQAVTDALTFGARVAAVTVSRAGANPPWAREL